jgi:hypothetical protein
MTQSDLEWPRTAMKIIWMTQYDFRWVKSTSASPFWGPSDLDISIYSDSVTSQRETTILCANAIYITQCTEVGRAFLIHFQKRFLDKVLIGIKIARKLKFYIWMIISDSKSVKKGQKMLKKASNWTYIWVFEKKNCLGKFDTYQ